MPGREVCFLHLHLFSYFFFPLSLSLLLYLFSPSIIFSLILYSLVVASFILSDYIFYHIFLYGDVSFSVASRGSSFNTHQAMFQSFSSLPSTTSFLTKRPCLPFLPYLHPNVLLCRCSHSFPTPRFCSLNFTILHLSSHSSIICSLFSNSLVSYNESYIFNNNRT